jgi:Armadillo/beta-catenin-like repeat
VLEANALQPVIGLLSSKCTESQREAALLLGQFATADPDYKARIVQRGAVPPLIAMLSAGDAQLKEMAAFALGRLAQNADNQAGIIQVRRRSQGHAESGSFCRCMPIAIVRGPPLVCRLVGLGRVAALSVGGPPEKGGGGRAAARPPGFIQGIDTVLLRFGAVRRLGASGRCWTCWTPRTATCSTTRRLRCTGWRTTRTTPPTLSGRAACSGCSSASCTCRFVLLTGLQGGTTGLRRVVDFLVFFCRVWVWMASVRRRCKRES